ncbi:MAG: hypothetical protein QGG36_33350 [Pirellulaceae bacterium]|nr:hypothetical protein [Pirellulaceae bacterium]
MPASKWYDSNLRRTHTLTRGDRQLMKEDRVDLSAARFELDGAFTATHELGRRRNPLLIPGVALLLLSTAYGVASLFAFAATLAEVDFVVEPARGWGSLVFAAVLIVAPCAIAFGSLAMIRLRNYTAAWTAAILAVVPICSPLIIFGIPFGMWALVLLLKPEVREQFFAGRADDGDSEPGK